MAPKDRIMLCAGNSPAEWKQRVTPPGTSPPGKDLWQPPIPLPSTAAGCNSYLPRSSTLDRFLWTVQYLVAAGHYVLVDYHPMGAEQTSYDRALFVSEWAAVWRAITSLPSYQAQLKGRVFVDIMNEPDSMGLRWEASGGKPGTAHVNGRRAPCLLHAAPCNTHTAALPHVQDQRSAMRRPRSANQVPPRLSAACAGMTELYLDTMDALATLDPTTIFFINGAGQTGFKINWGNGFCTEPALIQQYGLSDPNPFFKALLSKPYRWGRRAAAGRLTGATHDG
jgi:hypothetical protein